MVRSRSNRKSIIEAVVTPGPLPVASSKYYVQEKPGGQGYGDEVRSEALTLYFAGSSAQQIADVLSREHSIDPPMTRASVWRWVARYRDQQALRSEAAEPALYERVHRLIGKLLDTEETSPGPMAPKDLAYLLAVTAGSIQRRHHMYIEERNSRTAARAAALPVPGHFIDAEWEELEPLAFPMLPAVLNTNDESPE